LTVGGSGPPFVLPLALYIFLKTNFLKPILLSHSSLSFASSSIFIHFQQQNDSTWPPVHLRNLHMRVSQ
jgi:hypothetical protein